MAETTTPDVVPAEKEVKKESEEKNTVEEKILKQVEYYFGDNNLPRDKFIKGECAKHDGWLPIATLLTFNRLKSLLAGIPEDSHVAKIAEVLKASELVDVNTDMKQLRRNPEVPLPDSNSENRTVYLKGFNRTTTTLDNLLEFFEKYEGMEAILMRYYKEKTIETEEIKTEGGEEATKPIEPKVIWVRKFKGSIFVVFKTPEQAQKILDEKDLTFEGQVIAIKMMHREYKAKKRTEYVERVEARNQKKKNANGAKAEDVKAEVEKPTESDLTQDDIVKGALVRIKNIPKGYSREEFKEKWYAQTSESDCRIIFADFNKGDVEGVIRLEKEGSAAVALKHLTEGKLKIDEEKSIDVTGFTEEEEEAYLQEITKKRLEKKRKPQQSHGGRGGRGRGRGRGGKRRRY